MNLTKIFSTLRHFGITIFEQGMIAAERSEAAH